MSAKTAGSGRQSPTLPPLTVARFEQATLLMERLVDENTDVFVGRMQAYRERQRAASSRRLTADEAAKLAVSMRLALDDDDRDVVALAEDVQAGDLRAVDEPAPMEVLLAAGVATAPAFLNAALRLVALIELPADIFEAAYEDETLDVAIELHVKDLRALDLDEARARAVSALDYLSEKAGAGSGEGLRLLTRSVWQALNQAADQMSPQILSGLSSLTDSAPPTDGPTGTSSTAFAGSAP